MLDSDIFIFTKNKSVYSHTRTCTYTQQTHIHTQHTHTHTHNTHIHNTHTTQTHTHTQHTHTKHDTRTHNTHTKHNTHTHIHTKHTHSHNTQTYTTHTHTHYIHTTRTRTHTCTCAQSVDLLCKTKGPLLKHAVCGNETAGLPIWLNLPPHNPHSKHESSGMKLIRVKYIALKSFLPQICVGICWFRLFFQNSPMSFFFSLRLKSSLLVRPVKSHCTNRLLIFTLHVSWMLL